MLFRVQNKHSSIHGASEKKTCPSVIRSNQCECAAISVQRKSASSRVVFLIVKMASSSTYEMPSQMIEAQPSTCGHAKRKGKRKLPRVLFVFDKKNKTVFGVLLLSVCQSRDDGIGTLFWTCARFVKCAEIVSLGGSDLQWLSTIVHMKLDVEIQIRMRRAAIGGTINSHFADYAGSRWHCWPVDFHVQCCICESRWH